MALTTDFQSATGIREPSQERLRQRVYGARFQHLFFQHYFGATEVSFTREIRFNGNFIYVFNSFIPFNFDGFGFSAGLLPNDSVKVETGFRNVVGAALPLWEQVAYEHPYDRVFLTIPVSPIVITGAGFVFNSENLVSTPLLVMFANERAIKFNPMRLKSWHFAFRSQFPTTGNTTTIAVTCRNGISVRIHVSIQAGLTNPVNLKLQSLDNINNIVTHYDVNPVVDAVNGYSQNFIMPSFIRTESRCVITGGGAGDGAKTIFVDFELYE